MKNETNPNYVNAPYEIKFVLGVRIKGNRKRDRHWTRQQIREILKLPSIPSSLPFNPNDYWDGTSETEKE